MPAPIVTRPTCPLCGRFVESRPTYLLLPGATPICWHCVGRMEGSIVGQARGPVILYRPRRPVAAPAPEPDLAPVRPASGLSAREREVVQLVSHGFTNAEIAFRLERSASTVAKHVSHALAKRGAKNRAELVATALGGGRASSAF